MVDLAEVAPTRRRAVVCDAERPGHADRVALLLAAALWNRVVDYVDRADRAR